jgi:probable HAF family extracellular repeat protein
MIEHAERCRGIRGIKADRNAATRRLPALLLVTLMTLSTVSHAGARQDDGRTRYKLVPLGTIKDYATTMAIAVNAKGEVVGQVASLRTNTSRAVTFRSGKLRALIKGEKNPTSAAQDINSEGQIVVNTNTIDSTHVLLWEGDEGIEISQQGAAVYGYAINDSGIVVGSISRPEGDPSIVPYVWSDREFTILDLLPDSFGGLAVNVNADGLIVGYSERANETGGHIIRAVAWEEGEITELGTLGWNSGVALGVNAAGQIVGRSTVEGVEYLEGPGTHATLWEDGEPSDLGTLGDGEYSSAAAINAQGDIVGRAAVAAGDAGTTHAVLWHSGEIYNLNDLIEGDTDVELDNAYDINDNGLIIATGNVDGIPQSFLRRCIPIVIPSLPRNLSPPAGNESERNSPAGVQTGEKGDGCRGAAPARNSGQARSTSRRTRLPSGDNFRFCTFLAAPIARDG